MGITALSRDRCRIKRQTDEISTLDNYERPFTFTPLITAFSERSINVASCACKNTQFSACDVSTQKKKSAPLTALLSSGRPSPTELPEEVNIAPQNMTPCSSRVTIEEGEG